MFNYILDLDDVVAGFGSTVVKKFGHPEMNKRDILEWDLVKYFVPEEERASFWDKMDYDFWFNLPIIKSGLKIYNFVKNESVIFCTSPIRTHGCIDAKIDWIAKYFPEHAMSFCITPVKHVLANHTNILIDDRESNVQEFIQEGGKAILVPAPWNSRRAETDDFGDYDPDTIIRELKDLRCGGFGSNLHNSSF